MSRKITYIAVALISIISIAIVAFFGVVPQAEPREIPAERIMFVDRKNGTEENEIKKQSTYIDIKGETMEVYYFISPATATDKKIKIYFEDYGIGSNITIEQVDDGVLSVDFHGSSLKTDDMFTIKLVQSRDNRSASHNYIIN